MTTGRGTCRVPFRSSGMGISDRKSLNPRFREDLRYTFSGPPDLRTSGPKDPYAAAFFASSTLCALMGPSFTTFIMPHIPACSCPGMLQ